MSGFEGYENEIAWSGERNLLLAGTGRFVDVPLQDWPAQWQSSQEFPTPQSVGADEFSRIANDAFSFTDIPSQYRIGEPHLPVAPFREHYLKTVAENPYTIVSSGLGSGKSTQLGLFHLEAGAPMVYVTSPRIVAARQLYERACYNLGSEFAQLAGYLTGNAADSKTGPDTKLVYITGRKLFNMVNRGQTGPEDVVIVDEAHEETTPDMFLLDRLLARQPQFPDSRLIISSGTIDTNSWARYLKNPQTGEPAPVLILPGRTFPLVYTETDLTVPAAMSRQINLGNNVLAFEPGLARMRRTAAKVQGRRTRDTIHLLYGDQSPAEQKAALTPDDHNHIVSTSIGQTSITPLGKDAVIDSGLANVGRYHAGVRAIETIYASKSTIWQRGGRVARTKDGVAELAVPADAPPPPAFEDRPDYETPEIQNTSVAGYIVELLGEGVRMEDTNLKERPTHENLQHDYLLLQRLGAIALNGDQFEVTPIGEATRELPLDISAARMMVEAHRIELDSEQEREPLILQVAAVAAVLKTNGILDASASSARRYERRASPKDSLSTEQMSDVLFELDIFTAMFAKQQKFLETNPEDESQFDAVLRANDILPNRYNSAVRTYRELCYRQGVNGDALVKPYGVQRRQIIDCQIAGVEEIFVRKTKRAYVDIRGARRIMGRRSIVAVPMAQLVMGTAFDIRGLRKNGRYQRRFVSGGSAVTLKQLQARVPHRLTQENIGYVISRQGVFVEKQSHYFDGELHVGHTEDAPSPTEETRVALLTAMMTGVGNSTLNPIDPIAYDPKTPKAREAIKRWEEAQTLEHRSRVNFNTARRYKSLIQKVVRKSLEEVPLDVVDPAGLDHLIPSVYLSSLVQPSKRTQLPNVLRKSPDAISLPILGDAKEYAPVNYKDDIAYVTLTRAQLGVIAREDFAMLRAHHDVKLRFGTGKYQHFDAAFAHIEELQKARATKRERRELEREARALSAIEHGPSPERERAPQTLEAQEVRIKGD